MTYACPLPAGRAGLDEPGEPSEPVESVGVNQGALLDLLDQTINCCDALTLIYKNAKARPRHF